MQSTEAQEIKNLLMQMQTQQVSSAENKLATFAKDSNFFSIILSIITSPSEQQWLKTVTSSYLNSALVNEVQAQQLSKTSHILKEVLYNPAVKQLDKRCFEKSIINLLSRAGEQTHREWESVIQDFLKSKQNFDSAYLVMACFAVADQVPYAILRGVIQYCFQPILSSLQVCVQNANLLNEMIKMWIVAFDSLRRQQENHQILHFMSNSQRLLDLIDMLYDFQSIDNVIVCLNPHYFELNLLKYEAAQLNKRLFLFSKEEQIKCSILQQYAKKNFAKFARTVHILSTQKSCIDTLGCEDLLTTLISLQQLFVSLSPEQLTLDNAIALMENEIFPFIIINDEERQKFQQAPQQFNSLAEDCCDHQTYGILKTQAIKLLQTLGDKIEGCLKYALSRAIQSIKVNLGFVANYSGQLPILQIQTAILVTSVFSYGISNFQVQLQAMKVILCDVRAKQLPPLQMSRVFTFLAYNYQQVYKNPAEGQSWIAFALQYRVHPTTAYCAYDFLSNNVDDHFNEGLLEGLINQITVSQISLIWEIITKIIENHFTKFSIQGCILLISKLFERIKIQIVQIQSKHKQHTLDLINCITQFSSILATLKNPQMVSDPNKTQQILQNIWPIVELYRPALKWDFEDEIVKVIINIINVIPSIVPQIHPLVPQFIDLFKANGYCEKIYLRFFNQFILKASFTNDKEPLIQIIIVLKDALLRSIQKVAIGSNGKYQGSQVQRVTAGNILLIIQNTLAVHGTNILESNNTEFFDQVGSICLRLLPNVEQQAERTSTGRVLMSRALNTIFLCHMHMSTNCFYDYLARLKTQDLYHGYDTRVFVLCTAKQIFRLSDHTAIMYLIEGLLQIVGKSVEKDEVLQTKTKGKGKAKLKNQIRKIGDMDKILKAIDSPFLGKTTIGQEIINLFSSMNSANSQLIKNLIKNLTPSSLEILIKYVDLNSLGKKKRVIFKVVGVREGGVVNNIDVQHENQETKQNKIIEEDQQHNEKDSPKRMRNKIKMQGKQKTKTTARKIQPNRSD